MLIESSSNAASKVAARMSSRRQFLKHAASFAGLTALGGRTIHAQSRSVDRVIVIGAGIVGAAIAYFLAKRGCEVVVIDKGLPASQASGNTFAWINAAYANQPAHYQVLRQRSLDEYRRLSDDVEFPIRWSGSLEWFQDSENERRLVTDVEAFRNATAAPTQIIGRDEARLLEPNLVVGGDWKLAHSTNDGAVDAPATTQAIFDRALELGAQAVLLAEVQSMRTRRRDVRVATTGGTFDADVVVVAAGIGTRRIARMVGETIDTATRATPGIIATTGPVPMILNKVLYPPRVHIHQLDDGRVVIGEKAGPPAGELHSDALSRRPNGFPDDEHAAAHALRLLALARSYVPELESVRDVDVGIGWRPMPTDGLPIVGYGERSERVYFATMHSGITLAPIVGKIAAAEILDGVSDNGLRGFRPQRF